MATQQITDTIMMVRPAHFGFNEETAANNAFQSKEGAENSSSIEAAAIEEFDNFVATLRQYGVLVEVVQDNADVRKPDAIFPNNWISFHEDGTIITYPMFAPLRRKERRESVVEDFAKRYKVSKRIQLERYEDKNLFLEGTGSMILDRPNKIVYACLSVRTDPKVLAAFAENIGYTVESFLAVDQAGQAIYHTNVMMAVCEDFAVICLDSIADQKERRAVIARLIATGKNILPISLDQMNAFAGNMLQVRSTHGERYLVMSSQAFHALHHEQIKMLKRWTNVLHVPIYTIEKYGGGSARCMMGEVFLGKR